MKEWLEIASIIADILFSVSVIVYIIADKRKTYKN